MIEVCHQYNGNGDVIKKEDFERDYLFKNSLLYREAFCRSGQISQVFGAYVGICFDVLYFGGTI